MGVDRNNRDLAARVESMRVFFIGNSFTYHHNLPGMFSALTASLTRSAETGIYAKEAATLDMLWKSETLRSELTGEPWDFAVLQEQSTLGPSTKVNGIQQINDPAAFHNSVRKIVPEIRDLGIKPLLYLTWARGNNPGSQSLLTSAYHDIGKELDVPVVPVGQAWQAALAQHPSLVLHDEDGIHASSMGTYFAACVFYAAVFNSSPEGGSAVLCGPVIDDDGILQEHEGVLVEISETDAAYLQRIAWEVVRES